MAPSPNQAYLLKNFLQNLCPRSEGHLTLVEKKKRKQNKTVQEKTLCALKQLKYKLFVPKDLKACWVWLKIYKTKIHKGNKKNLMPTFSEFL